MKKEKLSKEDKNLVTTLERMLEMKEKTGITPSLYQGIKVLLEEQAARIASRKTLAHKGRFVAKD